MALKQQYQPPYKWITSLWSKEPLLAVRANLIKWVVVVLVGGGLGAYTLAAAFLPRQWLPLVVLFPIGLAILIIVGQIRKILLAMIIFDIPFHSDVYIGYREAAISGFVPGLNVSTTTIALLGLYLLLFLELLTKQTKINISKVFLASLPLALYIGFGIVSMVEAEDIQLSIFKLFLLVQTYLLFVYIVATVRTKEDIFFITSILLLMLLLESLMMIGAFVWGKSIYLGFITAGLKDGRAVGTLSGPNTASAYLSLLLALALSVFLASANQKHKWLAFWAFGVGSIALILTLSRGGWFAFVLSISILCLLVWERGWLPALYPIGFALITLVVVFLFQDVISARLFGDDSGAASARIPLMIIAFRMIMDNLLVGVGINNFTLRMLDYTQVDTIMRGWTYAVHNKYLLEWAEVGTAGFAAFFGFFVVTIRRGLHCWQHCERRLALLALGLTAVIIGHMVHMLGDLFNSRTLLQLLWILAALVTAIYHLPTEPALKIIMIPNNQSKLQMNGF